MRTLLTEILGIGIVLLASNHSSANDVPCFKVGSAKVWSILDMASEMDVAAIFPGEADVIRTHVPTGKAESNILAFLIELDGKFILADTGLGSTSGERQSLLLTNLARAGVKPEQVDIVAITHMHGDHIGGLLHHGETVFPNAVIALSRLEHAYWLNEDNRENNPTRRVNFDMAKAVVDAYADRLKLIDFEQEIVPGLTARDAVGHTPGHTIFHLESDGKQLLCVGDLVHVAVLQFARPDMSPRYDIDPGQAMRTRERYLRLVSEKNIPIAGMHLPNPGIGQVINNGDGSFTYLSLE